ncbi:response regulator [Lutibacter sp. HS1-25]|nr:response regulator [Lutibacter sp. HS1-25]
MRLKLAKLAMKNRFLTLFLFLITLIGNLSAQYQVQFSNNYPPYNYINEEGELVGFNIDILKAINNLYDDKSIKINAGDWQAINKALDSGYVQAIGGYQYNGNGDEKFYYSRSAINTSHSFFYNSKNQNQFSLEHFRIAKEPLVAIWKNDVLLHYVLSINPTAKFIYVKDYKEFVKALDRKDVMCSFGQRISGMYYALKSEKNYIKTLDHRILERNMGFKVSKNNPELAKILNNGLEVILANGTYQKIYDQWILEYDQPQFSWHNYLKYILIVALLFIFLIILNWILQIRVRKKTKDLQHQIEVNADIMQELEIQKYKAEESDRMKSAFLANMSHEIRTPMNGILGFTELLKSTEYSSEKQTQFINIIQQSGNRMLNTINNIIDISKLESGLESVHIKAVNVPIIVNELVAFFNNEAVSKGLIFKSSQINSEVNIPFYTDEYKLNSILTNLIKNALKFTKKGSIEIRYTINLEHVEFWIKDTGIGIPLDKQATIFNEFIQADNSHSSGYEGSGLGLSISKGYVHLLKGIIEFESTQNIGTTFYVRIPNSSNKVTQTAATQKITTTTPNFIPTNFKIIIAEDDVITFYFLKEILKDVSECLYHAKNGFEAVELMKAHPEVDLILMDVKMPLLNGFEATQQIRTFNKDVYIIAQTAFVQESYKRKIIEAGCNTYISKPINREKLFDLLKKITVETVLD